MRARVLLALVLLALIGCFGPTYVVQQYGGSPRPQRTIAVLRFLGSDSVRPLELDGEDIESPIASDARLHIEILPGKHTLTVVDGAAQSPPLTFEAEPSRVYRVVVTGGTPRVYEVDRGTDVLVREAPVPAAPPPPSAPKPEPAAPEDAGADAITL